MTYFAWSNWWDIDGLSQFRTMDENGEITVLSGFGPDGSLRWPDVLIDFDAQTVNDLVPYDEDNLAYYDITNGQMTLLPSLEGDVTFKGFHGGTLYATAEEADGSLKLYAFSASGSWVEVFEAPYESGQSIPWINRLGSHDAARGRDVWLGQDDAEVVTAQDGDEMIYTRGGADVISAGAGDDIVDGGAGSDHIRGENGADVLTGGRGDDMLEGGRGADVLSGLGGADALDGGDGADRLLGGGGADLIDGGKGADTLVGGHGDDRLVGRGAEDLLRGGDGDDVLHGDGGRDFLFGDAGDDALFGSNGNDVLTGGLGNDALLGGEGNDVLNGNAGADRLNGGAGNDRLTGNGGQDAFIFFADSGVDRITDFAPGEDAIILRQLAGQGITSFADLSVSQKGADTEVVLYGANRILLLDTDADLVTADDFVF